MGLSEGDVEGEEVTGAYDGETDGSAWHEVGSSNTS